MRRPSEERLSKSRSSSPFSKHKSKENGRYLRVIDEQVIVDLNLKRHRLTKFMERNIFENLSIPVGEEVLDSKSPVGWMKNMRGLDTWSHREIDWYLSENRLVFSCQSDKECDLWVTILNYLIN